ncbi:MAG: ATP synthase F1 subunit delta [Bacteroidetes bacterium]|nr:ATP synthase F1 subunit delta [Rhodothermia bacterium]MCS7154407.1 ATP synthase F1 subunit delta [Bacteroidota bacterium]MCX7907652.1 ATP synthase F1 subunit delta [Bacteroidota bacterium]MDW8137781.1 ATP synthase F1 subunit delta [Bacteroidota bacterium]MDW8286368.1 ATP synthase F1 subunit delta [Bacteroidota bacterium]
MMRARFVRHYAEVLLEVAQKQQRLDAVGADVASLRQLLRQSRELTLFFRSPLIRRDRKLAVVQALFEGRLDELTRRFLEILVRKGREPYLESILEAFEELRDEALGIVRVQLSAAQELEPELYEKICSALESYTGSRVVATFSLDRSLIGGLRIRLRDRIIDGSVRHQLEAIRQRLKAGYALN